MIHRLSIPTVKRCHLPVAIFPPYADNSILRVHIDRTTVQFQSPIEAPPFLGNCELAEMVLPVQFSVFSQLLPAYAIHCP